LSGADLEYSTELRLYNQEPLVAHSSVAEHRVIAEGLASLLDGFLLLNRVANRMDNPFA
jgi:hypothetical protein